MFNPYETRAASHLRASSFWPVCWALIYVGNTLIYVGCVLMYIAMYV